MSRAEQYDHLIQVLSGRTGTISWTIWPSHSGVIWQYRYGILNNMTISFRCYLAVLVRYPEQYDHLIQVLSGSTGTVSWTIWPSHSGVIWQYRYGILNSMTILFRCKIWSKQQAVTTFPWKSNKTTRCLLIVFHVSQNPHSTHSISLHSSQTMLKRFSKIHKCLLSNNLKNKRRTSKKP
jgi:hypothetical protein